MASPQDDEPPHAEREGQRHDREDHAQPDWETTLDEHRQECERPQQEKADRSPNRSTHRPSQAHAAFAVPSAVQGRDFWPCDEPQTRFRLDPPPKNILGDDDASEPRPNDGLPMNWFRAALSAIAVVVIAFVLLVIVPDLLLRKLTGLDRHGRVAVTTAWFTIAVVALAWGLRKLQGRHVV